MKSYQQQFIEFALANDALRFGEFTLKSGRKSPYFFNAGQFTDGTSLHELGHFYAAAIAENFTGQFDVLFGPAYKGIQLATIASIGLHHRNIKQVPVCYNRKETKGHGEGGIFIGAPIKDKRILLIDDVITAGTTIRDSVALINNAGGKLIGALVAIDRQERGLTSQLSGIQEAAQQYNIEIASIIQLQHIIETLSLFVKQDKTLQPHLENVIRYQQEYGASIT